MTSALTATRPRVTGGPSGLRYAHPTRRGAVVRLAQQSYSDRIVRLVTAAPIVAAAGMVVVQLAVTWSITASLPTTGVAAALVACYLPFHLHHVWAAAHARRPHSGGWTLAAMAVIIAAGTPLVGYAWLTTWVQLLVSVLIVLPRPWSVLAGGVLVAALGPLNILLGNENSPIWVVLVLLERTCAVLVPAWLSGALRQLRAARADLAAHAVLQERIRIDGELADTVGQSLADIAARGISAGDLAGRDRAAAERSLRALVDGSRGALAATRRIISAYQRVSLRAELDTAAALLNASGIRTSLVLPSGDLPEPAGGELTRSLRSAVDRLLHTAAVRGCEINVVRTAERLRLTVRADGAPFVTADEVIT